MKTLAAVLYALEEPLRLVELDVPPLQPGQVLVEVGYSGVCHTQLLEQKGKRGDDRFLPHTLGHEGSGTVLEVGQGVRKVKPGDRVVLSWIKGQGLDVPSTTYGGPGGRVNSGAIGTFMQITVTCENRVIPVPADLPLMHAALLGCAIPTGAGAVLNTAALRPGDSVAVFGVGGVGLSAVIGANLLHARQIIAIDVSGQKLRQALSFGATDIVNATELDPLGTILELTGGRGVDCVVESAGLAHIMEAAFQSVRLGGVCVITGNLPHGDRISIDPMELIKGRRLVGSAGGDTVPDRDIPFYASLYLKGRLPLADLITHVHPLEDVNRGLEDLEAKRAGRVMLAIGTGAEAETTAIVAALQIAHSECQVRSDLTFDTEQEQ